MSELSKLDALLHKTCIKILLVLRYQSLAHVRSLTSLSKIAYQLWRDHLFSQRNKTTDRVMGVGVESDREDRESRQNLKMGVGNIGGLRKIVS